MKKTLLVAVVALFASAPLTAALAVDVVNEDDQSHVLLINGDDGSKEVDIAGGQTISGICKSCAISVGDGDPVSVEGDDVVSIKGGKAAIGG